MLGLINHVVNISARRDRTEINSALLDALHQVFNPRQATIYRCYLDKKRTVLFNCAGFGPDGSFLHNAYLPEQRYCIPVDHDPLLRRCALELAPVSMQEGANFRVVFPLVRLDEPTYLIDVRLPENFTAEQLPLLNGLIRYFDNHVALLDYGETDSLTRLASRKTFDKHLFELLGRAAADDPEHCPAGGLARRHAHDGSHWLAVCDIDHFKQINDNFGHLIGDEVLIMLAQQMRQSLRFDDQLFRFGGEEFIALLQPTSQDYASAALERFRKDVEGMVFSRVGHVTISIGFSRLEPNDTPTDVIDRADEALYYAKNNGRNRVHCYETLLAAQAVTAREYNTGDVELF